MRMLTRAAAFFAPICLALALVVPGHADQVRPAPSPEVAERQIEFAGPVAAGATAASRLSLEDRLAIQRINAYVNKIGTMKGRFLQVSDTGGMAQGTFHLWRPGRLRFEYDPPAELLFIVDGTWVGVDDKRLRVVNRYPLRATPLHLLLKDQVDLVGETHIQAIERLPGQIRLSVSDKDGDAQGLLTLVFSDPGLELRQWIIVDAQGTRTTIALRDVERDMPLAPQLFFIHDYDRED